MKARLIEKTALAGVIARLREKLPVYAPVEEGRRVRFKFLEEGESARLDYGNSGNAPKNLFFPHTETLMRFTRTRRGHELVDSGPEGAAREMVLFGVRPCDVRSFTLLDYVFDRKNTPIPTMSCGAGRPR